jgi:hypothetical protein
MCHDPSKAVFCKESIECCPGIVSRYFCKLLLTIPVIIIIEINNNKMKIIIRTHSQTLPHKAQHLLSASDNQPTKAYMDRH